MGVRKATKEVLLDAWSAISYKEPLKEELNAQAKGYFAKSWLSAVQARRLNAYMVLAAYEANTARVFIDKNDEDNREENREYGDAALIIDQVLAALLGESQEIVVKGAENYDPDMEARVDDDEVPEGEKPSDEELAENREAAALADMQEFLRNWADGIHLGLRMADCERNSVQYGDGVYLLGWDDKHDRVTAAVMDPGFYFPVLPDTIDSYEYPERVHFAWELDGDDFPDGKRRLRRLTYSLEAIHWDLVEGERGEVSFAEPKGTKVDNDGRLTKIYPWSEDPSRYACYLTDATWLLDDVNDTNDIDVLTYEKASFAIDEDGQEVRDKDLEIDFVPIIHVPNTPPGGNHFGQSSLSRVLQLLDDLQGTDTDVQRASSTTGSPIIVIHGAKAPGEEAPRNRRALDAEGPQTTSGEMELDAGSVYFLGESGGATVVDTSKQLAELRLEVGALRERLSVNSRLPAAVLGTMNPSEAPSGYAIKLSFGPMDSMIRQMRLTRSVKYPLLLKMVQRLYQVNGELGAGPNAFAEMRFGSYLPADMAGTLDLVKAALTAKLISLETGIAMLVEAGFPIEDIAEEIEKIQGWDFAGANELADATGDANAVAKYLGRDSVDGEAVEPIVAPPTVPTPPVIS